MEQRFQGLIDQPGIELVANAYAQIGENRLRLNAPVALNLNVADNASVKLNSYQDSVGV